jgi:regulator of cell morphogenesis and NO signaling
MQIQWNDDRLGDIVRRNMHTAPVFEKFGLDYCCGGRQTLAEACADRQVDTEGLRTELDILPENGPLNVDGWKTEFLVEYIVNTHHQYVKHMLPTIAAHATKVAQKHGQAHPEAREIAEIFLQVKLELEQHLMKEERILFPYILQMAAAERDGATAGGGGFGTVRNPIAMMEQEHDGAGLAFERIRRLSGGYAPPEDACTTFRLLFRELEEFERDLHMHIHLENNVLHPRAIALEEELFATA